MEECQDGVSLPEELLLVGGQMGEGSGGVEEALVLRLIDPEDVVVTLQESAHFGPPQLQQLLALVPLHVPAIHQWIIKRVNWRNNSD